MPLLEWRGCPPHVTRDAQKFSLTLYLIAHCMALKNILFVKSPVSYEANLRLQNDTNIDHVQLKTEVQQPFEKDPIKIFKAT